MYTWISDSGRVVEQVRIARRGGSSRAQGHVIAADSPHNSAFSCDYEVELDSSETPRRILLRATTLAGTQSIALVRGSEGGWLADDATGSRVQAAAPNIVDVEVTFSVFFASLILRRHGLHAQPGNVDADVLTVDVPTLALSEETVTFTADADSIHGITRTGSTTATVDADGMIVDVSGLTKRA